MLTPTSLVIRIKFETSLRAHLPTSNIAIRNIRPTLSGANYDLLWLDIFNFEVFCGKTTGKIKIYATIGELIEDFLRDLSKVWKFQEISRETWYTGYFQDTVFENLKKDWEEILNKNKKISPVKVNFKLTYLIEISTCATWLNWSPDVHACFDYNFRKRVKCLLLIWTFREVLSIFPLEIIFKIIEKLAENEQIDFWKNNTLKKQVLILSKNGKISAKSKNPVLNYICHILAENTPKDQNL